MTPKPELPESRTDLDLIAAINRGDPEAFEALYWRHRDWVLNLAVRFTGDSDAALDVLQETFLYLLRKFPGFRLTCQLKTFLYPAVRNLSLAAKQKALRNQAADVELENLPADPASDPTSVNTADLQHVLGGLPEEHREVLLLRFVDDLSLAEISEALKIPLGTVKSRLHNALQALRTDKRTKELFEN